MSEVTATVQVPLTPEQIAEAFWDMNSNEQADFFAALDSVAGLNLCFQMAFVIDVIRRRSEIGDHAAMHGFQTMLNHAIDYAEEASFYRAEEAKRGIAALVGVL